jgi:hypothetical protein
VWVKAMGNNVIKEISAELNLGVRIALQLEVIDFDVYVHTGVNSQGMGRKRNKVLVSVEGFFGDFKFHKRLPNWL